MKLTSTGSLIQRLGTIFRTKCFRPKTEAQRIKIVLAISDQIEGKRPQSNDAIYLAAYKIAESV